MATVKDRADSVRISLDGTSLNADLTVPFGAKGLVIFAHGTGSSRLSPRNRSVAADLQASGMATLLLDLLTEAEERAEAVTRHLRFDIQLLSSRLMAATEWAESYRETEALPIGYFGASTGAAAAIGAAAMLPKAVGAIVSRGGRPDLAGNALDVLKAPTLLIVGGRDTTVIELNRNAAARMRGVKRLEIVPGATHLFEERGTLERVSVLASEWFNQYLIRSNRPAVL